MRGWSSMLVGVGLLGLGAWTCLGSGFNGAAILFLTAGAFLVYRGCRGIGITGAGDPTALAEFITNPAGALVDAVVDKAVEAETQRRRAGVDEPPKFDADAALARYMANRAGSPPQPAEARPAVSGFGRKGL